MKKMFAMAALMMTSMSLGAFAQKADAQKADSSSVTRFEEIGDNRYDVTFTDTNKDGKCQLSEIRAFGISVADPNKPGVENQAVIVRKYGTNTLLFSRIKKIPIKTPDGESGDGFIIVQPSAEVTEKFMEDQIRQSGSKLVTFSP